MHISSRRRLLSLLAMLLIVGTTLLSVQPAFAKDNGTTPYTVKPGDTLKEIADQYGLTVEKISAANLSIKDPNLLITGQIITLPVGRSEGVVATKNSRIFVWQRERDGNRLDGSERFYRVRGGDTITRIAKSYGITEAKLLEANPQIEDANKLYGSELIHIPYGLAENVPSFYKTPADTTSR